MGGTPTGRACDADDGDVDVAGGVDDDGTVGVAGSVCDDAGDVAGGVDDAVDVAGSVRVDAGDVAGGDGAVDVAGSVRDDASDVAGGVDGDGAVDFAGSVRVDAGDVAGGDGAVDVAVRDDADSGCTGGKDGVSADADAERTVETAGAFAVSETAAVGRVSTASAEEEDGGLALEALSGAVTSYISQCGEPKGHAGNRRAMAPALITVVLLLALRILPHANVIMSPTAHKSKYNSTFHCFSTTW